MVQCTAVGTSRRSITSALPVPVSYDLTVRPPHASTAGVCRHGLCFSSSKPRSTPAAGRINHNDKRPLNGALRVPPEWRETIPHWPHCALAQALRAREPGKGHQRSTNATPFPHKVLQSCKPHPLTQMSSIRQSGTAVGQAPVRSHQYNSRTSCMVAWLERGAPQSPQARRQRHQLAMPPQCECMHTTYRQGYAPASCTLPLRGYRCHMLTLTLGNDSASRAFARQAPARQRGASVTNAGDLPCISSPPRVRHLKLKLTSTPEP